MHDDTKISSSPSLPAKRPKMSKRRRSIILGAILAVAIVGTVAGVPVGTSPNSSVRIPLPYVSVASAFAPLDSARVIPANILAATVVPVHSTVVGRENLDNHNGPFDRSVSFSVALERSKLASFEVATFKHFGWKVRQVTSGASKVVYYCEKGGSDGNFWELSATIANDSVPSLGTTGASNNALLTIRLLIESFS